MASSSNYGNALAYRYAQAYIGIMTWKKGPSASDAARALGARGGKARARNLTADQRSASARAAARARWQRFQELANPQAIDPHHPADK